MENKDVATEVIRYGHALVKVLQAFDILYTKAGWFERMLINLQRTTYRQRLRSIVELAPPEISNQIFEEIERNQQNGDE